jgi:hypothetical protein
MLPPKKNVVLKKVLAEDGTYDILRTIPGDDERKKKAQEDNKMRSAIVEEMKKAGEISDKQYKYLVTKNNELLELNSTNIDEDKFLERRNNFKTKYKESPVCSGYDCPPDKDIPDERETQMMEIKRPELIAPTRRLEKVEVPEGPEYKMPGYEYERPRLDVFSPHQNAYAKWWTKPFRNKYSWEKTTATKPIAKYIQNSTGYDKKKMEGYENEEGESVPGEIETARMENRQINFTGANSIKDLIRQRKYKKEYPKYAESIENAKRYNSLVDAMNITETNKNK